MKSIAICLMLVSIAAGAQMSIDSSKYFVYMTVNEPTEQFAIALSKLRCTIPGMKGNMKQALFLYPAWNKTEKACWVPYSNNDSMLKICTLVAGAPDGIGCIPTAKSEFMDVKSLPGDVNF